MANTAASGALDGVRVLDLTEDRGMQAGKLLADLGADVIKVEKPGGCPARRIGPFKNDQPGLDNSLYFIAFNTNKKGITLNLESPDGREILRSLVKSADIVLEDFRPGRLKSLGLDYATLKALNPALILTSISGFGQDGPFSLFKSPDLVSFAMGGMMYVNGPVEGAPVVAPCEQSFYSSSSAAVCGILAALLLRSRTGEGQWIDAAAHEMIATLTGGVMGYSNMANINQRAGSQFGSVPGRIYPCKDGYVHVLTIRPNHWQGFFEVMGSPEDLKGEQYLAGAYRNANVDLIDARVIEFTMLHGKMEITEMCQAKGVPCTPVNTPEDFYQDPHIQQRSFFVEHEHPIVGKFAFPSPPFRMSLTPALIRRPAPLLGQHNLEIYRDELGFSPAKIEDLKSRAII